MKMLSTTLRRASLSLLAALCSATALLSQDFLPPVQSWDRQDYGASKENWAVESAWQGDVFAGNSQGLVGFDGQRWRLSRLPGGTPVRSLYFDRQQQRLYAGGYKEFGYWSINTDGTLQWTSLAAGLDPASLKQDEIWKIVRHREQILFHTFHAWYIYDGNTVQQQRTSSFMENFWILDSGRILVQLLGKGLHFALTKDASFTPLEEVPFSSPVVACLPLQGGSHLVLTRYEGMFRYDGQTFRRFPTQADDLLKSMDPICAALTPQGGGICVGTRKGGMLVLSAEGRLRFRLHSANVLDTDVIQSLHFAPDGFLWAATEDGIFRVNLDSPLRVLTNHPAQIGSISCAAYQEPGLLYLGTAKGLFRGRLDARKGSLSDLQEVALPAKGEVLSLSSFDGQLFCGTNGSSFEITPQGPKDVCYLPGGTCMDQGRIFDREVLVQGTYSNLAVFVREKGRWVFSHGVKDYLGPVRSLKLDTSGTIWAAPYYGGVYALQLSEDLKNIARRDFFESLSPGKSLPVRVTRFGSRVLFTDEESGWYTFNELEKKVVPYPPLHDMPGLKVLLPLSPLRSIFFFQDHTSLMRTTGADSLLTQGNVPFLSAGAGRTDAYSAFLPVSDSCYFFSTDNMLALWDWKEADFRPGQPPCLSLSRVTAHDFQHSRDTLLPLQGVRPRLDYSFRNLSFELRCHADELLSRHSYRYRIGGLDTTWRHLGSKGEITLNYLPHGRYELQLELVSPYSGVLSSLSYPFTIRPPFRHSPLAYLLYTLLGLAMLVSAGTALWYRERARRQQKETLFQAAIQKEKTERIASERDLLRQNLSASTFNLIHRNEALIRIKDTLTEQKLRLGKDYPDKDYRRICALIDAEIKTEAEWTQFEQLFDKAHNHFFRTLRNRYPKLTDNDLRVCAYLRMNISNKEIASLMNISDKGLEKARSRIRRKMGLSTEESLNAFIMQV